MVWPYGKEEWRRYCNLGDGVFQRKGTSTTNSRWYPETSVTTITRQVSRWETTTIPHNDQRQPND